MAEDFFERKTIKKPTYNKYDLQESSDLKSCGLDANGESFMNRTESFYKSLEKAANMEVDANPVGYAAQQVEAHFSEREMAFLLAKTILVEAIKENKEHENKKKQK